MGDFSPGRCDGSLLFRIWSRGGGYYPGCRLADVYSYTLIRHFSSSVYTILDCILTKLKPTYTILSSQSFFSLAVFLSDI
jgi:hypothetical protein